MGGTGWQSDWRPSTGAVRVTRQTLLLRQVHPNFVQNGEVGSIAFRPNQGDNGLLSVYDGDMITPERSHAHYTEVLNLKSAGVLAVTVAECASVGLDAVSSPLPDFDEHAHIDFTQCDKRQERSKSKDLLAFAVAGRRLHLVEA